jgi:site-specific recombinase XerD
MTSAQLRTACLPEAFTHAKHQAGVTKVGGIDGLRHAYATHLLVVGLHVGRLQRLMGQADIQTTLRALRQRGRGGEYAAGQAAHRQMI